MKITCVMVMSADGKSTKGSDPNIHSWTSDEDTAYFRKLIEEAKLIIMGRKIYEVAKKSMKHKPGKLRIILTHEPEKFSAEQIPNQLEFTNEPPKALIARLEQRGYTEALHVGGEKTNELFFKDHLVTDLWLTIEPKLLGTGKGLVGNIEADLELESVEKLNEHGTLLCKYRVINK